MARITVEDCIDKFPSRFELVLVASNRARKLHAGENPTVEIDNDKNTVIALREIAEETLSSEKLKNDLIEEYQTNTFSEDDELDELEDKSDEKVSDPEVELTENTDEANIHDEDHENELQQDLENNDKSIREKNIENTEDNTENLSDEDKAQDI